MRLIGCSAIRDNTFRSVVVGQTVNIECQREELSRFVREFSHYIDELNLDDRQKQRAKAQIAILDTELAGEPDPTILKQAGFSLRNIT
jgi:hypothetical protein